MTAAKKKKSKRWLRIILVTVAILITGAVIKSIDLYRKVIKTNVILTHSKEAFFYIHTGSNFEDVCSQLVQEGIVKNINTFIWVAEKKNYLNHVYPGRYLIKNGMNNNELVNLLRSGQQVPIRVTFQNIRTLKELAETVGKDLECTPEELLALFRNREFIAKYGFNRSTVISMFIPNTYEFYWNTSAEQFFQRMAKEYKDFWTAERITKAKKLNLSQSEVSTLASIVQAEQTIRRDERPMIAGLYLNRLRKGMRLESDPTVIYALGDFSVKRVWKKDRKVDSPYNTYQHKGLPPGPINLPEISSLKAVLNAKNHDYIFMCAKEDFSGYHNFARTNEEHNVFARRYRNELDKRKIYR